MQTQQQTFEKMGNLQNETGVVRMDQCALVLVHNGGVRTVENSNILDAPLLRVKR
jgi:hypothetical protein